MGLFSFLEKPKILYSTRLAQLSFATAFLVVICYAGTHRGWWKNINPPLALGVIAVLFTFAVAIYTVFRHHRGSDPFAARGILYTIVRLVIEIIVFLLWVGSAALALRPHGGCDSKTGHRGPGPKGQDWCWGNPGKFDPHWDYTNQPLITWDIAIAFSFVEIVTFVITIFLVFKDSKSNKVSGQGATYAA
ncbi:MAG: hypothetical protein HETSPECPRED_002981 [Heterodermia speciosa]|uniref:MARVEL domain-containing protein n=1 Tax=Heterodermia speciosa TaxID=116794 RepID=A0A8H3IIC7_9LECA|nr:MAG: hypothetical protein HETSPECPRED_002981 [Heterodermia speciosa]